MDAQSAFSSAIDFARRKMSSGVGAPSAVYLAASTFKLTDDESARLARALGV